MIEILLALIVIGILGAIVVPSYESALTQARNAQAMRDIAMIGHGGYDDQRTYYIDPVINNFGGFYQTEYYVHEARMNGATIHAPCVNHSRYLTGLEGRAIYLGFVHLQGMERATAHRIVSQRARGGPYK